MRQFYELGTIMFLLLFAPYSTSELVPNEFDCSNSAALLHDYLEEHGVDVGVVYASSDKLNTAHVYLFTENLTIEPTTKMIVNYSYYKDYGYQMCYSDWRDIDVFDDAEWRY